MSFLSICILIFEELWDKMALPVLVIQIFVALALAFPSEICTWIGSSGMFSFDQKKMIYDPILYN